MLICRKAGTEPGILVWVPVFQMIPLLRAAGMSGWWFLALFVPVAGLVVQIIWIFRLAKARGKGVLTAICLLLPFTSLFAWLYLAFSDAGGSASNEDSPPTKSVQTEPLPA
jgi:apolipoprotein N-acyltransferase